MWNSLVWHLFISQMCILKVHIVGFIASFVPWVTQRAVIWLFNKLCSCHVAKLLLLFRLRLCHFLSSHILLKYSDQSQPVRALQTVQNSTEKWHLCDQEEEFGTLITQYVLTTQTGQLSACGRHILSHVALIVIHKPLPLAGDAIKRADLLFGARGTKLNKSKAHSIWSGKSLPGGDGGVCELHAAHCRTERERGEMVRLVRRDRNQPLTDNSDTQPCVHVCVFVLQIPHIHCQELRNSQPVNGQHLQQRQFDSLWWPTSPVASPAVFLVILKFATVCELIWGFEAVNKKLGDSVWSKNVRTLSWTFGLDAFVLVWFPTF